MAAKRDESGGARSASPLHLPYSANRFLETAHESGADSEKPGPDFEALDGPGCPYNLQGWYFLNTTSGEVAPWRCGRNACDYCVQGNARRRARAIALAKPERALLLTQVGNEWQTIRDRLKKFRHLVAKRLEVQFEWVYHVEPNPQGTGHHVHAWQRGDFLPQDELVEAADSAGMGRVVFINKIRNPLESANYGLKGLGYGLKGIAAAESRSAYLVANGRRLTHQSRSFFVDSDGQRCGVRDAEREAARAGREEVGEWILQVPLSD